MSQAIPNESKDNVLSPQATNATTSPKEYLGEARLVACNRIQSSNGQEEAAQLPSKSLGAIGCRAETKTYNALKLPSTLLQSKGMNRLKEGDKALADSRERLFKTLFLAGLYFPSSSPFQPVATTNDRIHRFRTKIYRSVEECKAEEQSDCLFNQRTPKTTIEFPQSKKTSPNNSSSTAGPRLSSKRGVPEGSDSSCNPPPATHCAREERTDSFRCGYCGEAFGSGQALGGHMSRKHTGKSAKYNHKKDVRRQRELERMRLHAAKKKYFQELGYDYDAMMLTPEGKMKAKKHMNRSRIKRIKTLLSIEEIIV